MIRASAPGSILITGEHAVVYGHRAIVAAIDQRITVTLSPRSDRALHLSSGIAEPATATLDDLSFPHAYRFVGGAIASVRHALPGGFDLAIASQIDPTLGLGSSAAVTIATLGAVTAYTGAAPGDLHAPAYRVLRDVQGRGSGADLAASLMGGMIAYRAPPAMEAERLPGPPPLSLKYCGYKTPTGVVLAQVAERMRGREDEFNALYRAMGALADDSIAAARERDWDAFAATLIAYQHHMETLGVSDDTLDRIIADASGGAAAIKISGSGLGDCVLAVGAAPPGFSPVALSDKGLIVER